MQTLPLYLQESQAVLKNCTLFILYLFFFLPLLEIHVHSLVENNSCALAAARRMITSLFVGGGFLHAFLARDHALILFAGNRANQQRAYS